MKFKECINESKISDKEIENLIDQSQSIDDKIAKAADKKLIEIGVYDNSQGLILISKKFPKAVKYFDKQYGRDNPYNK